MMRSGRNEEGGVAVAEDDAGGGVVGGDTDGVRARRLRVLHVGKFYPPHKGGMETHLRDLCERLRPRVEAEVVVASDGRAGTFESVGGVKVSRVGTLLNLGSSPVCPGMARRIRDSKADIVHLQFPNPTGILSYLASGRRGRLVVTYQSDIVRQKILGRAFRPLLYHFLRRADRIIATSPNYVESSDVLRDFRERCRVIPLGIPAERFERADGRAVREIRERFGPRVVLGVGRLVYYKGFEHLVRAMRGVEGRLVIVGEGPLRSALEREAEECGVGGRVHFAGEVEDVTPYFQAADVFAFPSTARSEAFGIVQLEAMACGVPVVQPRRGSFTEVVERTGGGILVKPDDAGALAEGLLRLVQDSSLAAELGDRGFSGVREHYNISLMADRALEVYGGFDHQEAQGVSASRRRAGAA